MSAQIQRRCPSVQPSNRRRHLQERDDLGVNVLDPPNIPGPITMTVTIIRPITPSTTPILVTPILATGLARIPAPSITSDVVANLGSILLPTTTSSTQPLPTVTQDPLSQGSTQSGSPSRPAPPAAANTNGNLTDTAFQSTDGPKNRGLPTGTVIGIVIPSLLILLAAVVFLVRKRFVTIRSNRRATWADNAHTTVSSFGPREKFTNSTFPPQSTMATRGDLSPGLSFAKAQQQALAKLPPVPPLPPQVAYGSLTPGLSTARPAPSTALPTSDTGFVSSAPYNATVRCTYVPTLSDELTIVTGEVLSVLSEYDDGWGLCSNARREQGMVPLECLDQGITRKPRQEVQNFSPLRRTSSLAAGARRGRRI